MGSIQFPNKPAVETEVAAWNNLHGVGTPVVLHGLRGPHRTVTTAPAFVDIECQASVNLAGLPGRWLLSEAYPVNPS